MLWYLSSQACPYALVPVKMYCESQEKAQSQTHFSELFLSVFRRLRSAADHTLQEPSADVVARRLQGGKKEM